MRASQSKVMLTSAEKAGDGVKLTFSSGFVCTVKGGSKEEAAFQVARAIQGANRAAGRHWAISNEQLNDVARQAYEMLS